MRAALSLPLLVSHFKESADAAFFTEAVRTDAAAGKRTVREAGGVRRLPAYYRSGQKEPMS